MTKTSFITKKTSLCIAHKLYSNEISHEENLKIYGKCTNIHGHNLIVYITIKGEVDPITGMVANFTDLKSIIKKNIYDKVDHKYLNDDVEEFKNLVPTTENIAIVFWNWLIKDLPSLEEIKIFETDNNSTIYRG